MLAEVLKVKQESQVQPVLLVESVRAQKLLLCSHQSLNSRTHPKAPAAGVASPSFESKTEQRLHFKGDWHRLNVKLRSVGKAAVDEAEFERLVSEKDEVGVSPTSTITHFTAPGALVYTHTHHAGVQHLWFRYRL